MNPVIVLTRPNSLESQALMAWLWEWNLPSVERVSNEVDSEASKLQTVIDGKPFIGSLAEQREHLRQFFGLKKPILHD